MTDTKQGKWLRDDLVAKLFWIRAANESLVASSHVVDLIFWERIAIDHEADFGRQTEEVESLFSPVAKFELSREAGQCVEEMFEVFSRTFR